MAMTDCPECGKKVSETARTCPGCGHGLGGGEKARWYDNRLVVAVLLLLFFPVGLYALWRNRRVGRVVKGLVTVVILLTVAGPFLAGGGSRTTGSGGPGCREGGAGPGGQAARPVSDLAFGTVRGQVEGMTEARFKAYARSLAGTRVRWEGWVENVNEKLLGGYELWVDMDSPAEPLSVQDVTFDIPEELAMRLELDRKVLFEGDVVRVTDVLGSCQVRLENVTVVAE